MAEYIIKKINDGAYYDDYTEEYIVESDFSGEELYQPDVWITPDDMLGTFEEVFNEYKEENISVFSYDEDKNIYLKVMKKIIADPDSIYEDEEEFKVNGKFEDIYFDEELNTGAKKSDYLKDFAEEALIEANYIHMDDDRTFDEICNRLDMEYHEKAKDYHTGEN